MQFFIRGKTVNEIIQLNGRLIEIAPYGKFFVDHRHNACNPKQWLIGYVITEPQTGYMVSFDSTVHGAVASAIVKFKRRGCAKLKEYITQTVNKHGVLNEVAR